MPPGETDAAFWNATRRVRFNADSARVGHVTLRFPGRELKPVRLEVVTRPHRAVEFRPR